MNPAEFVNIYRHEETLWWYRGMRKVLAGLLDAYLNGRAVGSAIEAGCGTGYFSRLLQRERGWPVVAMDFSREALRFGKNIGLERASQADILQMPFATGTFDLAINLDVLQQLPLGMETQAATELARVLQPGGLLVVRTSALHALRSRHSEFVGEKQRFTRARLTALFTSAGIGVQRCTYVNSLLMPLALLKFRVWEPLTHKQPESGIQAPAPWLDRLLYRALAWEAAWLRAGHNLPLGQSLILIGKKAA